MSGGVQREAEMLLGLHAQIRRWWSGYMWHETWMCFYLQLPDTPRGTLCKLWVGSELLLFFHLVAVKGLVHPNWTSRAIFRSADFLSPDATEMKKQNIHSSQSIQNEHFKTVATAPVQLRSGIGHSIARPSVISLSFTCCHLSTLNDPINA